MRGVTNLNRERSKIGCTDMNPNHTNDELKARREISEVSRLVDVLTIILVLIFGFRNGNFNSSWVYNRKCFV